MKKRGQILAENTIFITLNLIFLTMLILFVFSRTSNVSTMEDKYSKQIALMIDAAEPGMRIHLNMEDAFKAAKDNGIEGEFVHKTGNTILVKLKTDQGHKGHSYSFFNNVDASVYIDSATKNTYVITVNKYLK